MDTRVARTSAPGNTAAQDLNLASGQAAWSCPWLGHEPKQTGIWIVSHQAGALLNGKLHPAFLMGQDCGSDRVANVTLLLLVFALCCINISPVPRPAVL